VVNSDEAFIFEYCITVGAVATLRLLKAFGDQFLEELQSKF